MPGLMIHLLTAHKVRPEGSTLFWVGNLAPDAVSDWRAKEVKHLRSLPDRSGALAALASKTDPQNDFDEGQLLHLFLDWKWDLQVRAPYMEQTGEGWFPLYRNEIRLSSSYAFHHTPWARRVWDEVEAYDPSLYGKIDGAEAADLKSLIHYNYVWHLENNIGPSPAFSPEMLERFTDQVAEDYKVWRAENPPRP